MNRETLKSLYTNFMSINRQINNMPECDPTLQHTDPSRYKMESSRRAEDIAKLKSERAIIFAAITEMRE
jgi:hypothetical protein